MKRKIMAACILAITLLTVGGCGCSNGTSDKSQAGTTKSSEAATESASKEATEASATATAAETAAPVATETAASAGTSEAASPETAAPAATSEVATQETAAPTATSEAATPETVTSASTSGAASGTASSEGKTVSPLPSGIDMNHLDDCTVAVSFDKGDAFVDDTGAMQLRVKVYTYDLYDMVDIHTLQAGDQITICQQNVKVTVLERKEDGTVLINGGMENGGYDLVSSETSGFYIGGLNDAKEYYELGEATLPVSADFEFEDSSDLEKGACTYYPGDFLTDDAGITYHFVPENTTITIQGGSVIRMERVYMP